MKIRNTSYSHFHISHRDDLCELKPRKARHCGMPRASAVFVTTVEHLHFWKTTLIGYKERGDILNPKPLYLYGVHVPTGIEKCFGIEGEGRGDIMLLTEAAVPCIFIQQL